MGRSNRSGRNGRSGSSLCAPPLNDALGELWEEWEVPGEADEEWSAHALAAYNGWREGLRERQLEIDESIARYSESEVLYDRPYEDNKRVRVAAPFTVESLSPHRVLDPAQELPATERTAQEDPEQPGWESLVIDHLKTAGIQNTKQEERLRFTRLDHHANSWVHAEGEFEQDGETKTIALSIDPQWGTVGSDWVRESAKEALRGRSFDVLAICAIAFDSNASEAAEEFVPQRGDDDHGSFAIAEEERPYGRLPVRVNPDLAMGDELLRKTGSGNLFMVFSEPDVEIDRLDGDDDTPQVVVRIHGVDVYDPTTGVVRSSSTNAWAIQQDARELDVQHLLGHAGPEMVRRYTASYRAEDAARRHARFSPADQMLRPSPFAEPAPR